MQYNMGRSGLSDVVFFATFSLGTHSRSVLVILPHSSIHPSIHPTQYIVPVIVHYTILFQSPFLGLFEKIPISK